MFESFFDRIIETLSKGFLNSFKVVSRILSSNIKGGALGLAVSSEAHRKSENKSRLRGGGGWVYTLFRREINRTNFLRQYVYLLLCFHRVYTLQHTIPPGSRVGRMEEVRLLSGDRSRRYQECNLFVTHFKEYSLKPDLF